MATDLLRETRISLTALAREQGVSIPTVWRWAQRGIRGVRLETYHVGARRYTTEEAFSRWVAATQVGEQPTTPSRTSRQREAAIRQAERELERAGV